MRGGVRTPQSTDHGFILHAEAKHDANQALRRRRRLPGDCNRRNL